MIRVFVSSTDNTLPPIQLPAVTDASGPRQFLEMLESRNSGLCERLVTPNGNLRSGVSLLMNVEQHADGRLLDSDTTRQVRDLDERFQPDDHSILLSLFNPDQIVQFLLDTLAGEEYFKPASHRARPWQLSSSKAEQNGQMLFAQAPPEPIYPFVQGKPVAELLAEREICVELNQLLPLPLAKALSVVLEGSPDLALFRLRAFQEDVLRHALIELSPSRSPEIAHQPLLLSIPTGGGKTEAFVTPILAHLLDNRTRARRRGRVAVPAVRAMVVYPTRALAIDQARRLAQILFEVNTHTDGDARLSIGVLTGDTPYNARSLSAVTSLLQLCPRCSGVLTQFEQRSTTTDGRSENSICVARCSCGAEVDFFRFTREDVVTHPPDILVTSPDMLSRTLQLPGFNTRLFTPHLEVIAFDEVHAYSGTFGCHVAHLLRRVEDACGNKPFYMGLSATIRNAREVACALFDAAVDEVRYLRPHARDEAETAEERSYLNYESEPTRYRHHYALAPGRIAGGRFARTTSTAVSIAHVIGHSIRDAHFRKTLIFSNSRDSTDNIVQFGRDHEERFYLPFVRDLLPRLLSVSRPTISQSESVDEVMPEEMVLSKIEDYIISSVERWYSKTVQTGNLYKPTLEFGWHRGGLDAQERLRAVNRFVATKRLSAARGESPWPLDILSATSTLELGMDIGDVSIVINCGAPFTINEYTQRVGRGGRRKDGLALTIIDPTNALDLRFLRRFTNHTLPRPTDFESVPLVVSNRDVCRVHILARLFDYVAQSAAVSNPNGRHHYGHELCVGDLRNATAFIEGRNVRLSDDPRGFAEAMWDVLFSPETLKARFTWLLRETQLVPGAQETTLTGEDWRTWFLMKCHSLYDLLQNPEITDEQPLTGQYALDPEFVPDLRGVGATVELYWRNLSGDKQTHDAVALHTAIRSRPPGGRASHGNLTFRITRADPNPEAQGEFADLLRQTGVERATSYFHHAFSATSSGTVGQDGENKWDGESVAAFPSDPRDVRLDISLVTPRDLEIEISPSRFYCPQCGATYSHKKAGDTKCTSCRAELRQVSELYECGGCGETFSPPVPKVCLNPECVERARSSRTGAAFLESDYRRVNRGTRHNDYFRFTALPKLHWQCRACQTVMNFHAHYELPPAVRRLMDAPANGSQLSRAEREVHGFIFQPESWWRADYDQQGFHRACFSCPKCRNNGSYRKISVVNAPTSRSVVHEYILHGPTIADDLHQDYARLKFERVKVMGLARERFETFYSGVRRTRQVKSAPIFPKATHYLAEVHEAHAVFLNFGNALDQFLSKSSVSFMCEAGRDKCDCRKHHAANEQIVTGTSVVVAEEFAAEDSREQFHETTPVPHLMSWEYGRTPDPRRKWCNVVAGLVPGSNCPGSMQPCKSCTYFNPDQFKRYLVLHTLKHALLKSLPIYTGATRGQIHGIINPNDENEQDMVLLDNVEGGSGCIHLLRQNWDSIWFSTGEILSEACQDPGLLVLAHGCDRFNHDLCPVLARAFFESLSDKSFH